MEELVAENRYVDVFNYAYIKLFPNQFSPSYLRTVAGLRRTRGGINAGVNDRMAGSMVPVPMY